MNGQEELRLNRAIRAGAVSTAAALAIILLLTFAPAFASTSSVTNTANEVHTGTLSLGLYDSNGIAIDIPSTKDLSDTVGLKYGTVEADGTTTYTVTGGGERALNAYLKAADEDTTVTSLTASTSIAGVKGQTVDLYTFEVDGTACAVRMTVLLTDADGNAVDGSTLEVGVSYGITVGVSYGITVGVRLISSGGEVDSLSGLTEEQYQLASKSLYKTQIRFAGAEPDESAPTAALTTCVSVSILADESKPTVFPKGAVPVDEYGTVFTIDDNGNAVACLNGKGKDGKFVVPAYIEIDGKTYEVNTIRSATDYWDPVQGKEVHASMTGNSSIKDVTLPSTIKSIEQNSFSGCTKLENIDMGGTQNVGYQAFTGCTSLTNASGESVKTLTQEAFRGCSRLQTLNLPSVESLGYRALKDCSSLKTLIAGNVKSITQDALDGCVSLETLDLPSVETVDYEAFTKCANLKYVYIPKATNVGQNAFSGCANLVYVDMSSATEIPENAFKDCTSLTHVKDHNAVKIDNNAFYGCTSLDKLDLPLAESVGYQAFYGCSGITSISIPKATVVGGQAFTGCDALESVDMGSVLTVPGQAFKGCTNLREVDVHSATEIGQEAFSGCTSLASISLPSAAKIDDVAFEGCTGLVTVSAPAVTSIGYRAFKDCTSLTTVEAPNVTSIGYEAFLNCGKLDPVPQVKTQRSVGAPPDASDLGTVVLEHSSVRGKPFHVLLQFPEDYVVDVREL